MEYRREIDGLRALAILPVILYHAGFQPFSGGFVGVDIFFVISGYLITSLILYEKEANTFSLIHFYERRARRILPALFFVMFAAIIVAWFYLLPNEMKSFGQSITASAAFMANIYFYEKNNDYFGLHSEQNPMIHLWSLAVEEQYYVFFPIFIILMWRFGKRSILYILMIIAIFSLIASQWGATSNPSANFFLLPTRGWEFLIGSFIAFSMGERGKFNRNHFVNQLVSMIGILLILFSIFYFDKKTPFPSFWALIPTLGTALVILFSTKETISGKIFGNGILVTIGLISFSAYLWHQPLFAFNRILQYQEPSQQSFFFLSLFSLLLAYLTWVFVEQPFRVKSRFSRKSIFSFALIGSAIFIVFGVIGHLNSGYPERDPFYKRLVSNFGLSLQCNGNYSINATCATSKTPEVAFLGNSYAMHLIEGFKSSYPQKGFVQLTQDSCAPYMTHQKNNAGKLNCDDFLKRALYTIENTPSINYVFISSPFGELVNDDNMKAFAETINLLKAYKKEVIIVGPTPSNGTDFGKCFMHNRYSKDFNACNFERDRIETPYFNVIARLKSLALKEHVTFIDLTDTICDSKQCNALIADTFIYRDNGHLSVEGSHYIFKRLQEQSLLNL